MTRTLDVDYLVVGAGAMGMGFTDALVDHSDARVAIVDRRHGAGGHWLEDYPFVRLHQASSFYGVASTLLGDGSLQQDGPEAGLHERATAPEVCSYYDRVLRERMIAANQTQIEVDEPEEDTMALLMGAEMDRPAQDDMSEERMLRALMEAQGQR